jgi:SPX domain protein involved in polyphosphate accumulation
MYRYERKVRTYLYDSKDLVSLVKSNSALFKEHYSQRIVNSIYLDTSSHSFVGDNLDGISNRVKPRIRWYGYQEEQIRDGVLELKQKKNLLGRKEKYPFGSMSLSREVFREKLSKKLNRLCQDNRELRFLLELEASLMTRYMRQYFVSADQKFRVTIDTDIRYWAMSRFGRRLTNSFKDYGLIILELKYDQNTSGVDKVVREFPFRFSRSSKYVTGVLLT